VPALVPRTELEFGRWLSQRAGFTHMPRWLGGLELQQRRDATSMLADLYAWTAHEGNAWQFTLDELSAFFERMLASPDQAAAGVGVHATEEPHASVKQAAITQAAGNYLEAVQRMTTCLAELHLLSSSADSDPGFAPEEFTSQYQRSLYQSLRNLALHALDEVQHALPAADTEERTRGTAILTRQADIEARLRELLVQRVSAWRIRIHGNFHLGQLLRTGTDFIVTGFESGGRNANERRIKRSSLRDLAGLLHSIDFASRCALYGVSDRHGRPVGIVRAEDLQQLGEWARLWREMVYRAVVETYHSAVSSSPRLALADVDFDLLIRCMRMEHALTEVRRQTVRHSETLKPAMDVLLEQLPDTRMSQH
jgi:maltose alpha-D-glucosyltransferase/alpha-amylase